MLEWVKVIAPVVVGLFTLFGIYLTKQAVKEVHVAINSRFDEFLRLAKSASFAEGVAHEKAGADKRDAAHTIAFAEGVQSETDKAK